VTRAGIIAVRELLAEARAARREERACG
jgi:hypothetical protein